jgi:hypothetical protein
MEDNLKLWNEVEKTDPKFTKEYKGKGGFKGTAICAQWQRYKATSLWGSYGNKWGIKDEKFEIFQDSSDFHNNVLTYRAIFYYPDGEYPICSDIPMWTYNNNYKTWSMNNDISKKVSTDALTKGLSMLGFSADVFMGKFDDNKYVSEMKKEFTEKQEHVEQEPERNWIAEIKTASTIDELKSLYEEAMTKTEGKEKAEITREKDKQKTKLIELGNNSQSQRND